LCCCVPVMRKETGGHKWEETKDKYKKMCEMLKQHFTIDKDWDHVQDWLKITEVNVNQYQLEDQIEVVDKERADGRASKMRQCTPDDFDNILQEVNDQDNTKGMWQVDIIPTAKTTGNCTNMMKIINHHIRMMNIVEIFKQVNVGMTVSPKTDPNRKGSMEWRGVIDEVTKLEPGLKFPEALRYNQIRTLSKDVDEDWIHKEKGTEMKPHTLLLDPWGPLETNANGYIKCFICDVWIYFTQLYFVSVVFKFIIK